ncbi:MAG: helix-turn-helix domain-containing protein [Saprospiraceae bacterium]|nr:helix-turn-helix domain-containing protein [Saprospiraceae bacterium]
MEEKSKMANQLLSMSKVKSILRLLQQGISKRKIAERSRVSRKTVDKYEAIFDLHPLSRLELLRLSDKELYSVIAPPAEHEVSHEDLYTLFPRYEQELKRIGVTKLHLWESYKETYSEGVQYSQFCEHFRRYLKSQQISYVHEHKSGDKLMVDFAGKNFILQMPKQES